MNSLRPRFCRTFLFLVLVSLTLLNGCGPQQFAFQDVEKDLETRISQMEALKRTQPDLEAKLANLEKAIPKDKLPQPKEFEAEKLEDAESRFGIGYPWILSDGHYTPQEKSRLSALQRQVDDLGPKLEEVFKLEAKIRVLKRRF